MQKMCHHTEKPDRPGFATACPVFMDHSDLFHLIRFIENFDDVIQIRNVKKIHQSHKRAQCNVPVMSDPVHAGDRKSKTPEQVVMRKSFFLHLPEKRFENEFWHIIWLLLLKHTPPNPVNIDLIFPALFSFEAIRKTHESLCPFIGIIASRSGKQSDQYPLIPSLNPILVLFFTNEINI